jgi:oxygen-independent coproporphyrinogen III oxidase
MCHFKIDIPQVEKTNGVVLKHYFAPELAVLDDFVNDGLITQDQDAIAVTPKGRLLVRAIAMVFDKYLQQREPTQRFSKII